MNQIADSFPQFSTNTNCQLSNGDNNLNNNCQLSIGEVDTLADELVTLYNNLDFKPWYCRVIYEFGAAQVMEWRNRAADGNYPGRLFSKYVKEARQRRKYARI